MTISRRGLSTLVVFFAVACAKHLPPAFVRDASEAQAAYARGEYTRAAEHWALAAEHAPDAGEKDEAVYRRAASLERAGNVEGADRLYAELECRPGERAARAAFARAEIALGRGDAASGHALLKSALLRYPSSGLARNALFRYLRWVEAERGLDAARDEGEALLARLRGTELEEGALFADAERRERSGQTERALSGYLELAERFPYPRGAYWDDALMGASRAAEARGSYAEAIEHLERLLKERETARMSGSYDRPRYAEARFRIAELYRDRLGDPDQARHEFHRVFSEHPGSRIADDALFEEALIAKRSGDEPSACDAAQTLLRRAPESRYAGCAGELCARLAAGRECRPYVRRRIAGDDVDEKAHSSSSPSR